MVSPASSRSTAARASMYCRSVAATIPSRMRACSSSSGWRSVGASLMRRLVVHVGHGPQLLRLGLRPRVAQEVAAADFGTGEVLQQVGLAERRMAFDVEVKTGVVGAV